MSESVADLRAPTANQRELARRARVLLRDPLPYPKGSARPRGVVVGRVAFERRADVKAWVLRESAGRCELCLAEAPFVDAWGEPFLEVHHVVQLAHGGPDVVDNAVALCPNCHRRMHHAADRESLRAGLYRSIGRLRKV